MQRLPNHVLYWMTKCQIFKKINGTWNVPKSQKDCYIQNRTAAFLKLDTVFISFSTPILLCTPSFTTGYLVQWGLGGNLPETSASQLCKHWGSHWVRRLFIKKHLHCCRIFVFSFHFTLRLLWTDRSRDVYCHHEPFPSNFLWIYKCSLKNIQDLIAVLQGARMPV